MSAPDVRHPVPARLRRQSDGLIAAIGLDIDEGGHPLVEPDIELALLDSLIQPGTAKDQAPKPMHK